MYKFFYKCPLCNSSKLEKEKNGYLNRYSDDISKNLNVNEDQLNFDILNVRCKKCDLIFKKKWFQRQYLNFIFNKLIPIHPKGWDKFSNKFTKKFFLKKFIQYKQNKNPKKKNYYIRELKSIIDSVFSFSRNTNKKITLLKAKAKNIDSLKKNEINYLGRSLRYPEPFKRFSGFGNKIIFEEIEKIAGQINNYAEIGCPLWGNYDFLRSSRKDINCNFIKLDSDIFWGSACKKNSKTCVNLLSDNIKIYNSVDECINKKIRFDFLSAFLCLDHVTNPINFMKNLKKISNAVGLILEPNKKGVPIQHFTGWSKNSLLYLAQKNNFKIHDASKLMSNINHTFIIFY